MAPNQRPQLTAVPFRYFSKLLSFMPVNTWFNHEVIGPPGVTTAACDVANIVTALVTGVTINLGKE